MDEWGWEQLRPSVGQERGDAVEPAERLVRSLQESLQVRAHCAPVVRLFLLFPAVSCGRPIPLTALPINEESAC